LKSLTLVDRITIFGAVCGFVITRFFEDGNLLITNVVVAFLALVFRYSAKLILKLKKTGS
jgi:uncharacterized membrane protein YoaK (UPF0700 family)